MTDKTQPEALRLADELEFVSGGWGVADQCCAELRRQHTRIAELEAELEAIGAGGVQALSAAPAVPTSVKGAMRFTKKPVTIQAIQWTGENLCEVITFTDGPPDTRSHHAGMAWDDYRDLVARDGLKIYTLEGKMLASPGDWIIRGVKGELYPCKPDIFQETYAAASPTPPAEQQAAPKAAPGEVSDTQHSQFLSDVLTAAGLITHGKQCKALGERLADMVMRLRAAPQPAPAPLSDDAKDAARYRWLRATTNYVTSNGERIDVRNMPEKWDAVIDAALAAQGGKA